MRFWLPRAFAFGGGARRGAGRHSAPADRPPVAAMINDAGENIDLYIPRKWCVLARCARHAAIARGTATAPEWALAAAC